MSKVLNSIENYNNNEFKNLKEHYAGLASSQSPHTLIVTCADSRLCPQEFAQAKAGELFVVRNAGNLIPGSDPQNPSNEALTIEYGVVALEIKELLVCGHTSCGAMGGLMDTDGLGSVPLVQKGLENYKTAHSSEISNCKDLDSLIAWNVNQQLKTLMTYDFIKMRVESGDLKLTGAVYDFVNAKIVHRVSMSTNGEIDDQ